MGAAESTPSQPTSPTTKQSRTLRVDGIQPDIVATGAAPPLDLIGSSSSGEDAAAPPAATRVASVVESELLGALKEAEDQVADLLMQKHQLKADWEAKLAFQEEHEQQQLEQLEEEWSAKMGEYMQRNAQLRVDAKQALRRATAAEKELETAKARIKELEQGLEDAALGSDELIDLAVEEGTPVQSLGKGHGGFDLATPVSYASLPPGLAAVETPADQGASGANGGTPAVPGSVTSPSVPTEIDADTLLSDGRDEEAPDAAAAKEAEIAEALAAEKQVVQQQYTPQQPTPSSKAAPPTSATSPMVSPPRLTLEEEEEQDDIEASRPISEPPQLTVTPLPKSGGGCCLIS